jgi:lysophospholipid acyltransferase (LPLAT)-like uncharacterized protein
VQPGVGLLARRSGLPVSPVGMAADRAWVFNSWDRFMVPAPMARVGMAFGIPIDPADYDTSPAFCEALRQGLKDANEVARQAVREARAPH